MTLKAKDILAMNGPEELFSGPDVAKSEYRTLSKTWHPDLNKAAEAKDVFAKINVLYHLAEKKIAAGKWEVPGLLDVAMMSGGRARMPYKRNIKFELGEMFYGKKNLAFKLTSGFVDLFDTSVDVLLNLTYRDAAMEKEMTRYLPKPRSHFLSTDGDAFFVMDKTPDVFLLRDLQTISGVIDPKHVAWILNSVYNIACYLEYTGITHNAMTADTIFVSPQYHSCLLLGGWWYSQPIGGRLVALPKASMDITPRDILKLKKADATIDLLCIKALGRDLLGDITGMNLANSGVPAPMVSFLRQPSSGSARKDYASWKSAVEASYGARRFVELVVNESDIWNLERK